ncbi:hypothetical protein [Halomonas sp. OfavH-34-E]|uniref:nSTAND3 domain-containing NTPase n=1 Tax=Halomonas sp. OfavH-34-E TaxID=2954491 RepID=UPI0020978ADE|nr:hypothetical protein [Halomonas sp. OfavH-34-E]MCO7216698.1 hypothetical protein [Halomonas sp. OfavH-34-E]
MPKTNAPTESETNTAATLLAVASDYPLHKLGWKAFQDLCVGVAEECLRRPVQNFLPGNDAGRDGAFVGRWEGDDPAAGESTIQCKFTSKEGRNLSLSMLSDELAKAERLAKKGLAHDYIILTNHAITGESELAIRDAFQCAGVGRCRIYGSDFINRQIRTSSRLRMMAPRLYGLGDLNDVLDARAYAQAQLILSAMGEDLQRLVVTEAHRRSVRAISQHNVVLLLGPPASGKSTIGASIAVGASDIWRSSTIRAASPEDVQRHLSPDVAQFFWIDDAWGNTQYQRQKAEAWNQVFPLMQGAMKRGTRFLITSRDYIWEAAKADLKLQAIPVMKTSKVVIDVQELSNAEKAQILYNHLKFGDQSRHFISAIKEYLPAIVERESFLPETARRIGSSFFSGNLNVNKSAVIDFFDKPEQFLFDTISNISNDCIAAIASIFLNGGIVRSPVISSTISTAVSAFGSTEAATRSELQALNGCLLLLAEDEHGSYWTYKHPTVSDAFARYLAQSPELVELYLRGAKPETILHAVVCPGVTIKGATMVVPATLYELLFERIGNLQANLLRTFVSYRSNAAFSQIMLTHRPDILEGAQTFVSPIDEDSDARLLVSLHRQKVLPSDWRDHLVSELLSALVNEADSTVFETDYVDTILTDHEIQQAVVLARDKVLTNIPYYVSEARLYWSNEYPPDDHFSSLETAIQTISLAVDQAGPGAPYPDPMPIFYQEVSRAIEEMEEDYEPQSSTSAPVAASTPQNAVLHNLFRDVDE